MAQVVVTVTDAWLVRAQRAVAWSQGQADPVTVDDVAAEMFSRLNAVVVQQEQAHGIDPTTGADTPQKILAELDQERAARVEAEVQEGIERTAKEAAEAEIVRLTAELEEKGVRK